MPACVSVCVCVCVCVCARVWCNLTEVESPYYSRNLATFAVLKAETLHVRTAQSNATHHSPAASCPEILLGLVIHAVQDVLNPQRVGRGSSLDLSLHILLLLLLQTLLLLACLLVLWEGRGGEGKGEGGEGRGGEGRGGEGRGGEGRGGEGS